MTGSAGARETEAELRGRFDALGYQVRELSFSFSTIPGRYGLPAAGAALALAGAAAAWSLAAGAAGVALAALLGALALAALPLLTLGPALRGLPWGRVETANLLFTRAAPRWIVMAHRDTKSQLVPILVRTAALTTGAAAWAALTALSVASLATATAAGGIAGEIAAAVLAAAGVVLALGRPGNRSPGALDNGTGLAALLALAPRVAPDVGFLVTDAEELGLAGARAAVSRIPDVAGIINLDGLDDEGPIRIAERRSRLRPGPADSVAATIHEAARTRGLDAVRRPLPRGILAEHQPLAAAGWPALTLLKGRWRSLLRVHRPGDTTARLSGAGAAEVATLVATALGGATRPGCDTLRPGEDPGHSPAL
jgi:hypothetical protein